MKNQKKFRKHVISCMVSVIMFCSCLLAVSMPGNAAEKGKAAIKVACVGDSLTEGYTSSGGLKGSTAYPAVLQNLLGDAYEVGNFGKTSFTLMKGTDKSYWNCAEYQNSKAYDADVVIIMLGTNDSKAKYWNEEQFKKDAVALVESYETLESEPEVIFAASPQCYQTSGTDITKETVDKLHEVQMELIEEQGWESIDLYALTTDREDLYHKDQLHFTDAGYSYLAECMYEAVTGEKPSKAGSVRIPHTQTSGSTNYFTFAEGKWTAGSDSHTWSNVVDSADPRSTWYEVTFTGNQIDVYSGKNYMMGNVEYFVDGISYGIFDLYHGSNINSTWITTISGLKEGIHTFRAEATGERNPSGKGNLAIDAAEVIVYSEHSRASMGSEISRMFQNQTDPGNNSWVFVGGEAVQGTFEQLGGARNYIGHFEEYARNQKSAGDDLTRQRYVINTGAQGQQLSEVIGNWKEKVTKFDPRAVSYLVGVEDYRQGLEHLEEFQESLRAFIDLALNEKANHGSFAVIQKPFAVQDPEMNELIEAYCAAVDEVTEEYAEDAEKYETIVVIDHYTQTKNNTEFQTQKLNEDGSLNELGHLEIGRQFVAAVMNRQDQYPCQQGVRMGQTAEKAPEQYVKIMPNVTAGIDSLKVRIPDTAETQWNYEIEIDGVTVNGTASGNPFKISGLCAEQEYVLKIQSTDGKIQLTTVKGVIKPGRKAVKDQQERNENQQRLADLMEEKDSLTWLFLGDSITHGLVYTYGYAGTPQLFEKFLKDDLGRTEDVVINTSVSGAHTVSTLNHIEQRMEKYVPDVVTIMLGTNDPYPDPKNIDAAIPISADQYEANLKTIIARIREINPEAVIILRSPTPMTADDGRKAGVLVNLERMKKVAAEDPQLIYVDQYTEVNEALQTYEWLDENGQLFLGNWLHPGINGQIVMAKQLIRACGLWTEDSAITNLYYQSPFVEETSSLKPILTAGEGSVALDVERLKNDSKYSIGSVSLTVSGKEQTYAVTVKAGTKIAAVKNLPAGEYEAEVMVYLTNAAKKVTFAKQVITVSAAEMTGTVERICGKNRYETGFAAADILKKIRNVEKFDTVVVATGKNFADALSGSYLAAKKNAPILLTDGKNNQVTQLLEYVKENVTQGGTVYLLGGTTAVPESVEKIQSAGYHVKRLKGASRYETNLQILKEAGLEGSEIIIATGKTFADSLSASAVNLPIMLVKPEGTLTKEQKELLKGIESIYIVGGENAVSTAYEAALEAFGTVERISGSGRYETSTAIAEKFFGKEDLMIVANGKNFPDGLCGGPLAAVLEVPLLLTVDGKTDAAETYASANEILSGYVLGGESALKEETVQMIFQ